MSVNGRFEIIGFQRQALYVAGQLKLPGLGAAHGPLEMHSSECQFPPGGIEALEHFIQPLKGYQPGIELRNLDICGTGLEFE